MVDVLRSLVVDWSIADLSCCACGMLHFSIVVLSCFACFGCDKVTNNDGASGVFRLAAIDADVSKLVSVVVVGSYYDSL